MKTMSKMFDFPVSERDILKIAIWAMREQIKKYALDANMLEYGFTDEHNTESFKKCRHMSTAIAQFEKMLEQLKVKR